MSYIREIGDQLKEIRCVAAGLRSMADAFSRTGNGEVAMILYQEASNLIVSSGEIDNIVSAKVDADFRQAQSSSATLLETALAGIQLGREEGKR